MRGTDQWLTSEGTRRSGSSVERDALPWQAVEWYGSEVPRGIAACGTGAWQHDGKSAKHGIEILMIRYDAEHDPEHD